MNRFLFVFAMLFTAISVLAQEELEGLDLLEPVGDGTHLDEMAVEPEGVDTTFMGYVELRADSLSQVVLGQMDGEPSEGVMGYRVGLFFDNSGAARSRAAEAVALCDSLYGDIVTTLSYDNPYFKVSAGYCTSLEEALVLLQRMQRSFPKAFLVSERIVPAHLVEVRRRELDWQQRRDSLAAIGGL